MIRETKGITQLIKWPVRAVQQDCSPDFAGDINLSIINWKSASQFILVFSFIFLTYSFASADQNVKRSHLEQYKLNKEVYYKKCKTIVFELLEKSKQPFVLVEAMRLYEKYFSNSNPELIQQHFTHQDVEVRQKALSSYSVLQTDRHNKVIEHLINEPETHVFEYVVKTIFSNSTISNPLKIELLTQIHNKVRSTRHRLLASEKLYHLGDKQRFKDEISKLIKSEDRDGISIALDLLSQTPEAYQLKPEKVQWLLKHPNKNMWVSSLAELSVHFDQDSVLFSLLKDENKFTRYYTYNAMANSPKEKYRLIFKDALKTEKDEGIKITVLNALSKYTNPIEYAAIYPTCIKNNESELYKYNCFSALLNWEHPNIEKLFRKILKENQSEDLVEIALKGLRKSKNKSVHNEIVNFYLNQSENSNLKFSTAVTLAELKYFKYLEHYLNVQDTTKQINALHYFMKIKPNVVIPYLPSFVKSKDSFLKLNSSIYLAQTGDFEPLLLGLNDENEMIKLYSTSIIMNFLNTGQIDWKVNLY